MAKDTKIIEVRTTTDSRELADQLAAGLLEEKLCACVSIHPNVSSQYWWKGRIETATEQVLKITTLDSKYDLVEKYILEHHNYETPAIFALEVTRASSDYLAWVKEVLR